VVGSGSAGGAIGLLASRHAASDLRRVAPLAGTLIAWALLGLIVFGVWIARGNTTTREPDKTSDWPSINAEMIEGARNVSAKAWLLAIAIGSGVTGEFLLLSRNLWWLTAAPLCAGGAWLLYRRSAEDIRAMVEPMDEPTTRFWNRTRSP
jgi:hypothetical protein